MRGAFRRGAVVAKAVPSPRLSLRLLSPRWLSPRWLLYEACAERSGSLAAPTLALNEAACFEARFAAAPS